MLRRWRMDAQENVYFYPRIKESGWWNGKIILKCPQT
jgi:hypothetical protein